MQNAQPGTVVHAFKPSTQKAKVAVFEVSLVEFQNGQSLSFP